MKLFQQTFSIKKMASYLLYVFVAIQACVLAFLLVVNVITPSFSKTIDSKQAVPQANVSPAKAPTASVPQNINAPQNTEFAGSKIPKQAIPQTDVPPADVPQNTEFAGSKIPKQTIPQTDVPTADVPQNIDFVNSNNLDSKLPTAPKTTQATDASQNTNSFPNESAPQDINFVDSNKPIPNQTTQATDASQNTNSFPNESAPQDINFVDSNKPIPNQTTQATDASQNTNSFPNESAPQDIESISDLALKVKLHMAPFIYNPVDNSRDPFKNPIEIDLKNTSTVTNAAIPDVIIRSPPEIYNLDQIHLKGIIWNTNIPKVLLKLPDSNGYYTLIKGDKIGKNGVIFEIRENEIVVVISRLIGSGENRRVQRIIKIKKISETNQKA